jgi:hypothetical protein
MTGTDPEIFAPLEGSAQFFTVASGVTTRREQDVGRSRAPHRKTG